jgi:hypothetical protein
LYPDEFSIRTRASQRKAAPETPIQIFESMNPHRKDKISPDLEEAGEIVSLLLG